MPVEIYLETGAKKTFACALNWPGWGRGGRGDEEAVQALLAYAPRYARPMQPLGFKVPAEADLVIVERLQGGSATDFGVPEMVTAADYASGYGPTEPTMAAHLLNVFKAGWDEFDRIYRAAEGLTLTTGPRGGGRDRKGVTLHVLNAGASYLGRIGGKLKIDEGAPDLLGEWRRAGVEILAAMELAAQNGVPEQGPRGGKTWPLPYFIRRFAWHVLDHAWEIEDRSQPPAP